MTVLLVFTLGCCSKMEDYFSDSLRRCLYCWKLKILIMMQIQISIHLVHCRWRGFAQDSQGSKWTSSGKLHTVLWEGDLRLWGRGNSMVGASGTSAVSGWLKLLVWYREEELFSSSFQLTKFPDIQLQNTQGIQLWNKKKKCLPSYYSHFALKVWGHHFLKEEFNVYHSPGLHITYNYLAPSYNSPSLLIKKWTQQTTQGKILAPVIQWEFCTDMRQYCTPRIQLIHTPWKPGC